MTQQANRLWTIIGATSIVLAVAITVLTFGVRQSIVRSGEDFATASDSGNLILIPRGGGQVTQDELTTANAIAPERVGPIDRFIGEVAGDDGLSEPIEVLTIPEAADPSFGAAIETSASDRVRFAGRVVPTVDAGPHQVAATPGSTTPAAYTTREQVLAVEATAVDSELVGLLVATGSDRAVRQAIDAAVADGPLDGLLVADSRLTGDLAGQATASLTGTLLGLAVVSIFIGLIVLCGSLGISVSRRAQLLHLRRAIGFSRRAVCRGEATRSARIGLASAAVGAILGIGATLAAVPSLPPFVNTLVRTEVEANLPVLPILTLVLGTGALAWVLGLVMGRIVTRTSPHAGLSTRSAPWQLAPPISIGQIIALAAAAGLALVAQHASVRPAGTALVLLASAIVTVVLLRGANTLQIAVASRLGRFLPRFESAGALSKGRSWQIGALTGALAMSTMVSSAMVGMASNSEASAVNLIGSLDEVDLFVQVVPSDQLPVDRYFDQDPGPAIEALSTSGAVAAGAMGRLQTDDGREILVTGVSDPFSRIPALTAAPATVRDELFRSPDGVIVSTQIAARRTAEAGDQLSLRGRSGEQNLTIVGQTESILWAQGLVVVPMDRFTDLTGQASPSWYEVTTADGADIEDLAADLRSVVGPDVSVFSGRELREQAEVAPRQVVSFFQTIALMSTGGLAVAIAALLLMDIGSKRRERQTLWSLGFSRAQIGRLTVTHYLPALLLGCAIGLLLGAAFHRSLLLDAQLSNGFPITYAATFSVYWVTAATVLVLSIGMIWLVARRDRPASSATLLDE